MFEHLLFVAGILGCAVFSVSGALAAAEKKHDVMSFILLGVVTGIGGGTVRDVILNKPESFWLAQPLYLNTCIAAAIATYFLAHHIASKQNMLVWMDAAGMALFSVLATQSSLNWNDSWMVAMAMGMITATFGGIIRDVLLNREPVLLGPEIYVSASLLGSLTFLLCNEFAVAEHWSILAGIASGFGLRGAAIVWNLRLPKYSD